MELLEYTKEQLEQLDKETLLKLKQECYDKVSYYQSQQMTKKILINSLYGAMANKGFSLFNEKIAQSITGNGRFFIQYTADKIEDKLQSMEPSKNKYIVYGDTDSCVGDTIIETTHGKIKIEDFYERTAGNWNQFTPNGLIKKPYRKLFVKSMSDKFEVEFKSVKYIMKHFVEKRMYKIKTHGREVIITEDHSVIINRNGKMLSVKPKDILKTDKLIFIGYFDDYDLNVEERKIFEQKALEVDKYFEEQEYSKQALWKTYIPNLIKQKFKGDWVQRCERIREIGLGITKEKMLLLYGDFEGNNKWNEYCERQSYTNSQEYKNMTDEEFEEYNKSRAVTLDNMIKKYGKEEGTKKFEEYKEKQAYTNTYEYFIEKYGEIEGEIKYFEYNTAKGHSLESYELRIPDKNEAFKAYEKYWKNLNHNFYSQSSSELFEQISKKLNIKHCYYAPKTKEFGLWCEETNSYMFYDFVMPEEKICIEYNGNCFHGNPKIYKPSDHPNPFNKNLTAQEIWDHDKIKLDNIKKQGYKVLVVWENEIDIKNIVNTVKELMA